MELSENDLSITWGDTIQVKKDSPEKFYPGRLGAICGVRELVSSTSSNMLNSLVNTRIYTVEFGDGNTVEIPAKYLIKVKDE
jgi:hypothetical protein